jgi:hypothetical protein
MYVAYTIWGILVKLKFQGSQSDDEDAPSSNTNDNSNNGITTVQNEDGSIQGGFLDELLELYLTWYFLAYAIIPLTEKNIQAISSHGLMTLEGYLSNSNEVKFQQAVPENAAKILLQVCFIFFTLRHS